MPPGSFFLPAVNRVHPEKYYSETEQSIYIPTSGPRGHNHQFHPQTRVVLVKNKPNEQIDSLTPTRGSSGPLDLVMTVYPHLPELLPQPHDSTSHSVVHEVRMVTPAHGYLPTNLKLGPPRGNGLISPQPTNIQPHGFNDQHLSGSGNSQSIQYHSFTEQDISPLNFIRPSARHPLAGGIQNPNSGFNSDLHSLPDSVRPSTRNPYASSAQYLNAGSDSGFHSGQQEQHSSLDFFKPSTHDPLRSNVETINSGSDFGFVSSQQMHSNIQVVSPQDSQLDPTTSKPQEPLNWQHDPVGADANGAPTRNLVHQKHKHQDILTIPGHSREIIVRTKMATFPDSITDSDDSSFAGIEIITKDSDNDHVLYVVGNRTNFKPSDQLFHLNSVSADQTASPVTSSIQVSETHPQTEPNTIQKESLPSNQLSQPGSSSANKSISFVGLKTKFQVPEISETHQKSVDGSPPQAAAAESHGDLKTTASRIPHSVQEDATKNTTEISALTSNDQASKIFETSTKQEQEEEVKDLDGTESIAKPFYKFRTISPKGAVYTVKQGHSKVKFFGFNALHGPFKRVPEVNAEKKSLTDWTVHSPESRKTPIKKSIAIKLKRKTVRPVYFHKKPQNVTT